MISGKCESFSSMPGMIVDSKKATVVWGKTDRISFRLLNEETVSSLAHTNSTGNCFIQLVRLPVTFFQSFATGAMSTNAFALSLTNYLLSALGLRLDFLRRTFLSYDTSFESDCNAPRSGDNNDILSGLVIGGVGTRDFPDKVGNVFSVLLL